MFHTVILKGVFLSFLQGGIFRLLRLIYRSQDI